jgi:hypothetical protein
MLNIILRYLAAFLIILILVSSSHQTDVINPADIFVWLFVGIGIFRLLEVFNTN